MRKTHRTNNRSTLEQLALLLFLAMMTLSLSACGSKGALQESTATYNQDNMQVEIKYDIKDDQVIKMVQTTTIDFSAAPEEVREQVVEAGKQAEALYASIDGTTYESDINGDHCKEVITMDLSKKDTVKALVGAGLLPASDKNVELISFEKTREAMEQHGWTYTDPVDKK